MNESSKFYQTDFQDLSADEMEAMIAEKKSTLRSLDSEKRDLQTERKEQVQIVKAVSYTHLRAHETESYLQCGLWRLKN